MSNIEKFSGQDSALVAKARLYRRMFRSGVPVAEIRRRNNWSGPELARVYSIASLPDTIRYSLFNKRLTSDQAVMLASLDIICDPELVNNFLCSLISGEMTTTQLKAKVESERFYFQLYQQRRSL